MWRLLLLGLLAAADDIVDKDGERENSRKVLGSSVVTSVSVIMDAGNGSKIFTDAVGKPVSKPVAAGEVASPIELLNPDRYEFYTFDDTGDLVKRLMTLEEIHDIIATGDDDGFTLDSFTSNGFVPEKRVNDVVHNVQNVLKEEIKMHKNPERPQFDTPDVSDSWSMILPAVFGNSGADIKPEKPITHVTPDTIMLEPMVMATTEQISTTEKVMTLLTKKTTAKSTTTTTETMPMINVEIITNSNSTTERTVVDADNSPIVEIKPLNDLEATKENMKHVSKSTKRPFPVKVTTFRPMKKPTTPRRTPTISPTTELTSTATKSIIISRTTEPTSTTTQSTTFTTTEPTSTTAQSTTSPTTEPTSTTTQSTTSTTTEPTSTTTQSTTSTTTEPTSTTTQSTTSTTTEPTSTTTQSTTSTTTEPTSTTTQSTTSTTTEPTSTTTQSTTSTTTEPTSTTTQSTTSTSTTLKTLKKDTVAQPSTVIFEKIAPPSRSTTAQTTSVTEVPTTSTEMPTITETVTMLSTELPETTPTEVPTTTVAPVATTESEVTSTLGSFSTFFTITDTKKETTSDDLSTLSTEYVNVKTSTTEAESTEKATSLDQFLLSSTNIYEINSELSELQQTTDSGEQSTEEKFLIRLTNPTEPPTIKSVTTTDRTFMESIEQLISQAVGTVDSPVAAEKEAAMVQEMIVNSGNKPMPEVLSETATVASNLVAFREATTVPPSTLDDMDLLSDSVGSLLSQVYGQGSTTVEGTPGSTTEIPTTLLPSTTSTPSLTTAATTTTTTISTPHIINITIISNENRTLPKADLSLEKEEEDLFNAMRKNSSLASMVIPNKLLKLQATSSIQAEPTTTEEPTTELTTSTTIDAIAAAAATATTTTTTTTSRVEPKPSIEITIDEKNETNWTLVSTLAPHSAPQQDTAAENAPSQQISSILDSPPPVDLVPKPLQGFGLEDSTAKLDTDIYQFVQLCNELAFGFWKSVTTGISSARSVIVSPFAATSLLAMVFLGARGATSGEMNEILKLDDMVTFNPHLIFKNVSEMIEANADSGVAVSAIVRELYSDRSKGKLLGFYKERVRQFYDGHVEEASFREIGDVIRRRTNLLIRKNTDGKISEFLKDGSIIPKPPLAGISVSIFQTDCSQGSSEGRDGELHFVVLPSLRQRRLIPIPAVVYRSSFLAGYEPSLDATAAALGTKDQTVSTIFVVPGQQGTSAPGDGLARLEKRLVESSFKKGAWSRLLRSLIPRPGLELQIPRFQHRSLINATQSLKRMGLHDLFDAHKADLKGLNGAAHELHLSDVIQINDFATCGERRIGEAHHREVYPATSERRSRLLEWEEPRDYQRAFHDPLHDPSYLELPLSLRPRQARLPDVTPRLRFDRPFLYFVRHNPSGLILHMGRFHPRLLP